MSETLEQLQIERRTLEKEIVKSAERGMYHTVIEQAERIIELGIQIVVIRRSQTDPSLMPIVNTTISVNHHVSTHGYPEGYFDRPRFRCAIIPTDE